MPRQIKAILVVRNDRFGEFLLNIPAFRALKETFTDACLIAVVDPAVRELAMGVAFIDETIEWARTGHGFFEKLRLVRLLKKRGIDVAVMLNPSKEFNILTFLLHIPTRVGYDRKWGFLLTHRIEDKKYLCDKHEIDYNLDLVGLIGAKTEDKRPSLTVTGDMPDGFHIKEKTVAVHPWTSDAVKQWPEQNFFELVGRLVKNLDVEVVIIGGKEEQDKSSRLFKNLGERVSDLTGKTTLSELAVLLKNVKLLISADSGPVHLAAAVGTPVIALFRNDIPGKSAHRWGPRGEKHRVMEKSRLSDITVEEALTKVKEVLKNP